MENMKKNQLCIKAPDKETARIILKVITECTNLTDLFFEGEPVDCTVRFCCDGCEGCEEYINTGEEYEDDFIDKLDEIYRLKDTAKGSLESIEDALRDIEDRYVLGETDELTDRIEDAFELVDDLECKLFDLEDDLSELKSFIED